MDNHDGESDYLPLSADEQRVLDLFDEVQRLRLEIAVINALASHKMGTLSIWEAPQEDLLEARAKLKLRDDAVEAVMTANPILKAVHNSTDASPAERDLLPFVERRDEAAVAVAGQASEMETLRSELTRVQADTARLSRGNVELTAVVCDLAAQLQQKQVESGLDSPETQGAVARLKEQVASRRKRWRAIKGVASGVVAGSGIDWACDDELCDMVLDPEGDIEDQRL